MKLPLIATLLTAAFACAADDSTSPYLNPDAPLENRVQDLIAKLKKVAVITPIISPTEKEIKKR